MTRWRTADPTARLTDPGEVKSPDETSFAKSQASVNFVALEPGWLPADCDVAETTLRPEQPPGRPGDVDAADVGQTPHSEGNPTALRSVVAGDDRRLRIKEFLYDWAPPAASVAPLWETRDPTPVDCGAAVGWLGVDYKDNRGACVQRDRTQVELSVLAGEFADDELARILSGLTPADESGARTVRRIPFHRLAYWTRYRCEPVAVPHGLWSHAIARPYHRSQPVSPVALAAARTPVRPLVPTDDEYVLDSAVAFPDAGALECVFRHRTNGSDHLWLTAAGERRLAPDDPPDPSSQPAEIRTAIDCRGTTVHYAALTADRGAWEAVWTEDGVRYAVYGGSSPHLDGAAFRQLLEGLAAP